MAKICQQIGCENTVFGGGYCKWHQNSRTDKKPKRLKITPIRVKIVNKGLVHLYKEIAAEQQPYSYLTDIYISELTRSNFAHVVPKSSPEYKEFCAKDKDNILLLTMYEHHLLDNGTEEQRKQYADDCKRTGFECNWQRIYDLKEQLTEKYKQLKKEKNGKC